MKLIFFGTPEFAACSLRALIDEHEVLSVVTQPDRPSGRGGKITFSAVKETAISAGIPVMQPEKIKTKIFFNELKSYGADIFVVAAYGRILPERVLNIPQHGSVNVHASLLPKLRGAAPIQRAIMNGEKKTGVTIMQMDEGIDTGDIILQKEIEIHETETGGGLHDKLAPLGASALLEALFFIEKGEAKRMKQDDELASYAPMIGKETGHINWNGATRDIINQIRGLNPFPAAYAYDKMNPGSGPLKIFAAEPIINVVGSPGEIRVSPAGEIIMKTGDGAVVIKEIQKTGGRRMDSAAFQRGRRLSDGDMFI